MVGARPQFVKLAPVAAAFDRAKVDHEIVHTGQHYDSTMSDSFFASLKIPAPLVNLNVGSDTHAKQTSAILVGLESVFLDSKPDWILAYGDTNSTLAAAICATKLSLPLAHLEAGLRSFNRNMPEEINRVLTDHASNLCLAPSEQAVKHLTREGLAERSVLVGDVMTDVIQAVAAEVAREPVASPIDSTAPFILATIHRPDNTDDPERLRGIVDALESLDSPVYLAAHPRLRACAKKFNIDLDGRRTRVIEPLSYPQLVQALVAATALITDSGGLQKEAYLVGTPTTTLRPETEWVETLLGGWNVLTNDLSMVAATVHRDRPSATRGQPYGDGNAAQRVAEVLYNTAKA